MKSTFMLRSAVWGFAVCVWMISAAHAVTIVEDHQPRASIVIDSNASSQVKAAAETLQTYIKKSTGATLPIRNTLANEANLHVGETNFTKIHQLNPGDLDQDGFILQGMDDKNVVIMGGSDWGTEFGVYDFLERYLNVRWLAGGDLFTDIPSHATVNIPAIKIRQEPVYRSRRLGPIELQRDYSDKRYTSMPWSAYKMYDEWGRFNRLRQRVEFHHNLSNLFPVSQFGKTHPEFYPMLNGHRYLPQNDNDFRWQPNFSAPEIGEVAASQIEKYFSENPEATSFSLGVNDSHHFDQSPETLARRQQLGGLPDEYATWINDVAGKVLLQYPNKTFGFLAYIELRDPPKNVKYNASAVPFITYELSRWSDPQSREFAQNLARQWHTSAEQLGWYDYFYGNYYMVPRSFGHAEADALQWLSQNDVKNYYGEDNPNFGEGPKDWVQSKLLWDPNQDVDALIKDWCEHAVGAKAAPSLQAYYALWEKFWSQDLPKSTWYNRQSDYQFFLITSYLLDVPHDYLTQSDRLLNEVVQLADTPKHEQRALKLQQMWQLYKSSVIARQGDAYWKNVDLQTEAQALDLLDRCTDAIHQAQQRLQILSDLRHDPLYGHPVYRLTSKDDLRGSDWGSSSLWSLVPWVSQSAAVRKGLGTIAQTPAPPKPCLRLTSLAQEIPMQNGAAETARQVLAAANGKAEQLLVNPSFENSLQAWTATGLSSSQDVAQEGTYSIASNSTTQVTLKQKVSYEPGTYYAKFSAYTSQDTSAKVTLSLKAVNQLNRQRGRNLPSGTLALHAGKWSTFVVPVTLTDLKVTDVMSLLVTVDIENVKANAPIYLDDIGLYRVQ